MPILNDIMDHEVIGPAIRKGLQQGRQEGRKEASQSILRRLLERRFGALPEWASNRVAETSAAELEEISVRIFDVDGLEQLFPRP